MAPDLQKQEMSKKNESWWNETITNLQQLQDPVGESKVPAEQSENVLEEKKILGDPTTEQPAGINVTVKLSWNTNIIKKSPPKPYATTVSQGTVLRAILDEAAMSDPAYAYISGRDLSPSLGDLVTCIGGLYEDISERMYWMIYENPKHLRLVSIDEFQPKNGSTITFQYQKM